MLQSHITSNLDYCQYGKEAITTKFNEWLIAQMQKRGETNYKVAKALGVSQSTIANWLDGYRPIKSHIILIAEYFGITLDELLATVELPDRKRSA